MQVFNLNKFPSNTNPEYNRYSYYDIASLEGDYNWDMVEALKVDAVFYWYGTGSYCGTGEMLLVKNNKWYLYNLGHCSCYGPLDSVNCDEVWVDKLSEARSKCSDDAWREIEPLVNLAVEHGYGNLDIEYVI